MKNHEIALAECGAHIRIDNGDLVLEEAARRIADALSLPEADVLRRLKHRESQGSTGLEKGVALPHCSLPDADRFTVGIITTREPIDFRAVDGKKSDIFVFAAGPEQKRSDHVRILAALTAQLKEEGVRKDIREADDGGNLQKMLSNALLPEEHEETDRYSLLLVYVQNQDHYESILEIISAEKDASVSVMDAKSAGSILHRLPLFATFWNESETREIHRIEAVLPADRTNRLIRKIEEINTSRRGVQISVLDLSYGSGVLDL